MNRFFWDFERDELITEENLREEFLKQSAEGNTDAENFGQYADSCMYYNNGVLEEIGRNQSKIINRGFSKDWKIFYIVFFYNDEKPYYSISYFDSEPHGYTEEDLMDFLEEHETDGCSFSGNYEEVMEVLNNILDNKCKFTEE